mgnify:CR=1 FL=1
MMAIGSLRPYVHCLDIALMASNAQAMVAGKKVQKDSNFLPKGS